MKDYEFSIKEKTLGRLLDFKKDTGYGDKDWNDWFEYLIENFGNSTNESVIEKVLKQMYNEKFYDKWITNFALNLNDIWKEKSAKELTDLDDRSLTPKAGLVIGRGPSINKHKHLEKLAKSNFNGNIICCDGALINALQSGVTPDKFPNFYVVTIDTDEIIEKYYDHPLVDKYGEKIKAVFSVVVDPKTVQRARYAGMDIHWTHALFDYHEGKKSFNQISALMVRAKKHHGLPAIQTGGNVGTSSWFISWQILKCTTIGLIGINHSWDEDDPWELIVSHAKIPQEIDRNGHMFQKMFPRVFNPDFNCHCILDPIFQYYSTAFKDFIKRSPNWVRTINATEGGCIFGERIICSTFDDFLSNFSN